MSDLFHRLRNGRNIKLSHNTFSNDGLHNPHRRAIREEKLGHIVQWLPNLWNGGVHEATRWRQLGSGFRDRSFWLLLHHLLLPFLMKERSAEHRHCDRSGFSKWFSFAERFGVGGIVGHTLSVCSCDTCQPHVQRFDCSSHGKGVDGTKLRRTALLGLTLTTSLLRLKLCSRIFRLVDDLLTVIASQLAPLVGAQEQDTRNFCQQRKTTTRFTRCLHMRTASLVN